MSAPRDPMPEPGERLMNQYQDYHSLAEAWKERCDKLSGELEYSQRQLMIASDAAKSTGDVLARAGLATPKLPEPLRPNYPESADDDRAAYAVPR